MNERCRWANDTARDFGRIIRIAADDTFIEFSTGLSLIGCSKSKSIATTLLVPARGIALLLTHYRTFEIQILDYEKYIFPFFYSSIEKCEIQNCSNCANLQNLYV